MSAIRRDLTIEQGTTWTHGFQVSVDSVPITSGWTVRSQVRARPDADTVLHEWSTSNGNASVDSGVVKLTVMPAVSSAWSWWFGYYDVEIISPTGVVLRVASGRVSVSAEVTR